MVAIGVVVYLTEDVSNTVFDDRALRVIQVFEVLFLVAFLLALAWTLLAPRRPVLVTPADHLRDRERARVIIATHGGGTLDYFALRDDKDYFFVGQSVVAYSARGGVCHHPIAITEAVHAGKAHLTIGGAPAYVYPGGGINFIVDTAKVVNHAFTWVPTPATVAPVEYTMTKEDYAMIGGHMNFITSRATAKNARP